MERCAAQGVNPGHPVGDDVLLVAITEQRSRPTSIGSREAAVEEARHDIAENRLHADPGVEAHEPAPAATSTDETAQQRDRARDDLREVQVRPPRVRAPELDVPERDPASCSRPLPPHGAARLPEIAEPEIVRHYNRLSKRNFDLDTGFYPLGSCTMKHNPKLHERVAALPGNARLHPLQDPARAQGALRAHVGAAGGAGGDRRPPARLPPAVRRVARRARGRAAHARLPRGPRRAAHEGPHARTPPTAPTPRR